MTDEEKRDMNLSIDMINKRLDQLEEKWLSQNWGNLDTRITQLEGAFQSAPIDDDVAVVAKQVMEVAAEATKYSKFVKNLEAFFGPMLEGKTPPLNGDDISTRKYVDESMARLSRVLREYIGDQLRMTPIAKPRPAEEIDDVMKKWRSANVRRVRMPVINDDAEIAAARQRMGRGTPEPEVKRPSRLAALVFALTGFTFIRDNGASL
jgi:hypothetical protein